MNKELLTELINQGLTLKSISKIVNKSITTVRYWIKKYQLRELCKRIKQPLNNDVRKCSLCKEVSSIDNFYVDRKRRASRCKSCIKTTNKNKRLEIKRLNPQPRKRISEEVKAKMSEYRKRYYRENPEKHPWRKMNGSTLSAPCEQLKTFLRENDIPFIEEYVPIKGRRYAIDIVFPQLMLGIEVNGGHHYNKDKTLTTYHQKRHDEIESLGWTLLEIPSPRVYGEQFKKDLLLQLKNENDCVVDLSAYEEHKNYRKKIHKPIEEVLEMIKVFGAEGTARVFGCSNASVCALMKRNNIDIKPYNRKGKKYKPEIA